MKKLFTIISLLAIAANLFSQQAPHNFTLLSNVTNAQMNATAGSSLWAYTSNGSEYALMGTDAGVSIVAITDPVNPVVLFNVFIRKVAKRRPKKETGHANSACPVL